MSQLTRFLPLVLALIFPVAVSAQPDYAPAHWVPPSCTKYYTSGNGHHFIVIHDMEGFYEASISYLNRCDKDTNGVLNVQASVYYLVNGQQNGVDEDGNIENNPGDAPAGDITQSVRESNYAWHARCWNTWMFGTEHEGFVTSPAWYTEAMYQASAGLQRHLCDTFAIPRDRNHIIGHNEWQNAAWRAWMTNNYPSIDPTCNSHTDPGQYWNWAHFLDLVNGVPGISLQPWSRLVETGSNATFSVAASGTGRTYQWRKNGSAISGANASVFTLSNVQASNAAAYTVVVSNVNGMVTSRVATLTVSPPWQLAFSDNFETNSSSRWNLFWGAGNGVSDFTTNWAFDYSATKYVSNGVTNFIPTAPNAGGTTRGLKVTVNKNDAVAATAGVSLYPKNLSFSNSYAIRFDLWINYNGGPGGGSGSTEYASCGLNHTGTRVNWTTDGTSSDGLWFAVDGEGGSGGSDYRCYVGNGVAAPTQLTFANGGLAASGATSDNVSDPFYGSLFPSPAYESAGVPGKHWVQVELSQLNNLITWQINGVVVAQRTNTSPYSSGDVMIGYFDPYTSIANPAQDNFAIFDNVRVMIPAVGPVISNQPSSLTLTQGMDATFTVAAGGTVPLSYQWRFNNVDIPGATASTYTRATTQTNDAGNYSVVVTNIAGTMISSNAVLTVLAPPVVVAPPASQAVNQGDPVTFSIGVLGTAPLSYRWQFNGQDIGATGSAYSLSNVQGTNAGNYQCVVSNSVATVTSVVATLTVNIPPSISLQPLTQSANLGSNVTFMVGANGSAPLTYEWRFNGAPISGATESSYTRASVQTNDAGAYSVLVTNMAGSVLSSNAVLTIVPGQTLKFDSISLSFGTNVKVVLRAAPGAYAVDWASNLVDWQPLTNVTIGNSPVEILDANPVGSQRFYRARTR